MLKIIIKPLIYPNSFIVQMRKQRLREVKLFAQDHTVNQSVAHVVMPGLMKILIT